ncbi:MAG: alpha/beta hydrolase [Gammaproteobacteria bacterium]
MFRRLISLERKRVTVLLSMFVLCTSYLLSSCTSTRHVHAEADENLALEQAEGTRIAEGTPIEVGRSFYIDSSVFQTKRRISVRLPAAYASEPDAHYPVVYVVDGGPEQDFPHLAGLTQSRDMNWTFAPFILVGIETVNRRHQIVPPATDVETYVAELGEKPGGSAVFRRFIRQDVMTWVNNKYRTTSHAAIMGESLAGLFIIETLFTEPDLFDDYIAITPSLWWEEMKYGREASSYLAKLPNNKKRLYITSADEGFRHQQGVDLLIEALEQGSPSSLEWTYFARGDRETHASIYHGAALDAFRRFFPMTTRYGRTGSLLSGQPLGPRTEAHELLLKQECTVDNALQLRPGQYMENGPDENTYKCLVFEFGDEPTAGNYKRLSEPASSER